MRRQTILRAFLFVVFFSIGAAALGFSVLCEDLFRYYNNKQILGMAKESLSRLESLNADYDVLLEQLEKDPNLIKRIAPVTLGTEPADANAVYPKATAEQLAATRETLIDDLGQQPVEQVVPDWITRCSEPRRRTVLFLAGAFLVLVSFIWFGSVRQGNREQ